MAAFLLWNIRNRQIDGLVQDLVKEHNIDVVLLVEYPLGISRLDQLLLNDGFVKRPSPLGLGVFTRLPHVLTRLNYILEGRVGFWQWQSTTGNSGLLALVHGMDRRNSDDHTRRLFFKQIADAVRRREQVQQHQHTIVAGDFNAYPFESAISAADGLHAIGVQTLRGKNNRHIWNQGTADFFYNPMWRLYGHRQHPDAGAATYHRAGNLGLELGWHMIDQVVLRPSECINFPEDRLQILDRVGALNLLDARGVPDDRTASDHLPVVFHWNL